jgi:hypothetical protein
MVALTAAVSMESGSEKIFSDQENTVNKITPEQAWSILKENGLDVSLEQADEILRFLRRLAILTLPQLFEK